MAKPCKENGGEMSQLTHKMASLGKFGKYPSNVERDLTSLLALPVSPFWIDIPVRDAGSRSRIITMRLPLLLPHELYHYLHDTCS